MSRLEPPSSSETPPQGFGAKRAGWFDRLTAGLKKSTQSLTSQVGALLTKRKLDADDLGALEDLLIEADLGAAAAARVAERFSATRFAPDASDLEVRGALAQALEREFDGHCGVFRPMAGPRPYVVVFVGVNGSGKTTTLGKVASELRREGGKVLIVAGDTFRAAAVEQLKVWAERADAAFLSGPAGADAAGLAFDAVSKARAEDFDVVLIDTAGRLQNKTGLMDELAKIFRVLKKLDDSFPHETLLVLDATVGRNAVSQAEAFGRTAGVTGLVMTKLDGTARGGVLLAAAEAGQAPVKLIGVGEGVEDLQGFDARAFCRSLVGLGETEL